MKNNTRALRAATQATVVSLAFAAAAIGGPAALADDPAPAPAASPAYSSGIDANHKVSLTINKRLNANTINDPTGEEDSNVTGEKLGGVTFSIQKINADITTKAGFQDAANMTPADMTPADTVGNLIGPKYTKTTDSQGVAKFTTDDDSITPGAYLVKETGAPEGVVKGDDFIVFLPMTNPVTQPVFFHPDYPPGTQPLAHAGRGAPPAFLGAARDDTLVDPQRNTQGLASRLQVLQVPVTLKVYDRVGHATLIGAFGTPLRWLAPVLDDVTAFVERTPPR